MTLFNFLSRMASIIRTCCSCCLKYFSGTGRISQNSLVLKDHFVSLSVGSTLVLKACGFIEDYQARILDVSETSLRLRTGGEWYETILSRGQRKKGMEISLQIRRLDESQRQSATYSGRPASRYCVIEASLFPATGRWSQAEFTEASRRMLWALRSHFMAC